MNIANIIKKLNGRGIHAKYLGNLTFELKSARSAVDTWEVLNASIPQYAWKAYILGDHPLYKRFFVEGISWELEHKIRDESR